MMKISHANVTLYRMCNVMNGSSVELSLHANLVFPIATYINLTIDNWTGWWTDVKRALLSPRGVAVDRPAKKRGDMSRRTLANSGPAMDSWHSVSTGAHMNYLRSLGEGVGPPTRESCKGAHFARDVHERHRHGHRMMLIE